MLLAVAPIVLIATVAALRPLFGNGARRASAL
jgi:hypothetical protein